MCCAPTDWAEEAATEAVEAQVVGEIVFFVSVQLRDRSSKQVSVGGRNVGSRHFVGVLASEEARSRKRSCWVCVRGVLGSHDCGVRSLGKELHDRLLRVVGGRRKGRCTEEELLPFLIFSSPGRKFNQNGISSIKFRKLRKLKRRVQDADFNTKPKLRQKQTKRTKEKKNERLENRLRGWNTF